MNRLTDPEAFLEWVGLPLTQEFRRFLKDRCQQLAMEWAQNSAPSESRAMQSAQVQAETLGDLARLECDDVRGFYGIDEVSE